MTTRHILTALALLASAVVGAQERRASCVLACPGEDAATQINLTWAIDTTCRGSYVKLTRKGRSSDCASTMEEYCAVYDSVYSKMADGTNFYEDERFLRCGAALKGLRPDSEYNWVVCDSSGRELSTPHRFKTAGARKWSACIISDFHSYTPIPGRLTAAMAMVDKVSEHDPSMDWVLHLGDVTAWGGSRSFWTRMYREPQFASWFWAGLNGNHDNMTRKYGLSGDFFRCANFVPGNGYSGQEGVCYHFRYGNTLFIMLNSEVMRSEEGLQAAREWVADVVKTARSGRNKPAFVVVCEHYQWFFGESGRSSQYERWNDLFDDLGVDLALAGNNHIYVRSHALKGGLPDESGTVYLQTSSSDNERGMEMKPELTDNAEKIAFRFTEGGRTVSAVSMQVDGRSMRLELLDREGRVLDTATIKAKRR